MGMKIPPAHLAELEITNNYICDFCLSKLPVDLLQSYYFRNRLLIPYQHSKCQFSQKCAETKRKIDEVLPSPKGFPSSV